MNSIAIPGYKIVNTLGVGGQATVYLAIQDGFEREVALKVMSPALAADPTFGERFIREAKIVARLRHPGIVTVYDVGEHDGFYYLAMEYLPGVDLRKRISEGVKAKDALQIVAQIAKALDYAHKQGYIHRDVKSENILFQQDGNPVLTDFGIAKASNSSTQMTQTGKLIGTPQYMSPEQCRGRTLDGRSDIYSLGIILYEMFTQKVPFEGEDSVAVCLQHVTKPIPRLAARQQHYQWLVDRMAAKKPEHRFSTALELSQKVEEFVKSGTHPELDQTETLSASRDDDSDMYYEDSGIAAGDRLVGAEERRSNRWPWVLSFLIVLGGVGFWQRDTLIPLMGMEALVADLTGKINNSDKVKQTGDNSDRSNGNQAKNAVSDRGSSSKLISPDSSDAQQQAVEQQIAQLLIDARTLQPLPDLEPTQLRQLLQNYLRVLMLDPNNTEANSGAESTYQRAAKDAREALNDDNEEAFLQLKNLISGNEPNHSSLTDLASAHSDFQNRQQQKALADSRRKDIDLWLSQAVEAMDDNRLSKPKGNSAWYFFEKTLAIESTNEIALNGIKQIKDSYAKSVQQALLNKNMKVARASIDRLAAVEKDSPRIIELRQQYDVINQQVIAERKALANKERIRKQEQARLEKLSDPLTQLAIQSKLSSARTAFTENRLVEPEGDNALDKYRAVLSIDPNHKPAIDGIKLVADRLVSLTTEAIQSGDESTANQWLNKLSKHFSKNNQISLLKQQIAEMTLELPQQP